MGDHVIRATSEGGLRKLPDLRFRLDSSKVERRLGNSFTPTLLKIPPSDNVLITHLVKKKIRIRITCCLNKRGQNDDVKLREIKLIKETISRPFDTPLGKKERKEIDSRIDISTE